MHYSFKIPHFTMFPYLLCLVILATADSFYLPECQTTESKLVPGVNFITYQVQGCDSLDNNTPADENTTLNHSLPLMFKLSRLEIRREVEGQFYLFFEFSLPLEDIIKRRLINLQASFLPANGHISTPSCRHFTFHVNQNLVPDSWNKTNVHVPYSCLTNDNLHVGDFMMHITSSPSLLSLKYAISWSHYYGQETVNIWDHIIVGVATSFDQVLVVFEPPLRDVQSLVVELLTDLKDLVNSSMVVPTETTFVFDKVMRGRYFVMITPESYKCNDKQDQTDLCASAISVHFLVDGSHQSCTDGKMGNLQGGNKEVNYHSTFIKLAAITGVVTIIFVVALLLILLSAALVWLFQKTCSGVPTLKLICASLTQLEIKAVQQLAMALSSGLGITVVIRSTLKDPSYRDGLDTEKILMVINPDDDSSSFSQEMIENSSSTHAQFFCASNDILAIVAFSHRNISNNCGFYDNIYGDPEFLQDPVLLDIASGIRLKSYKNIIFILFTEQPQPSSPRLLYSISQSSGRSAMDCIGNPSDDMLTLPLRPTTQKRKVNDDAMSVCQPEKFCFEKLLSSCNGFHFPHGAKQLYLYLKTRITKMTSRHSSRSADDISNDEKMIAAQTVAQSVLQRQFLFQPCQQTDITSEEWKTVDGMSFFSPDGCASQMNGSVMKGELNSKESPDRDLHITHPPVDFIRPPINFHNLPRDITYTNDRYGVYTDCDSFSNFSEVKKELLS